MTLEEIYESLEVILFDLLEDYDNKVESCAVKAKKRIRASICSHLLKALPDKETFPDWIHKPNEDYATIERVKQIIKEALK